MKGTCCYILLAARIAKMRQLTSKEFTFMYFCIFRFTFHQEVMIHFCLLDPCPTSQLHLLFPRDLCVLGRPLLLDLINAKMFKDKFVLL